MVVSHSLLGFRVPALETVVQTPKLCCYLVHSMWKIEILVQFHSCKLISEYLIESGVISSCGVAPQMGCLVLFDK